MFNRVIPPPIRTNVIIFFLFLLASAGIFILLFLGNVDGGKRRDSSSGYQNRFEVTEVTYRSDCSNVVRSIDSLISIGIITRTGPKTKTYVNGQFYEDSVVQEWAIDLPMKDIEYLAHQIDTILYNPYDSATFAGLVISKTRKKHGEENPAYFGSGFVCKKKNGRYDVKIYGHRTPACTSSKESSKALRHIYFSEVRVDNQDYKLNDIRYFNSEAFWRLEWE